MDHELKLAAGDMVNSAAWESVLIQLGIPVGIAADIRTIRVTCKTIFIEPS